MKAQPKLLILDPNIFFSRLLSKKLSDTGCSIEVENKPTQAVPAVERCRPDIILLELEFNTTSGFEICQAIKSNPQFSNIPILFHGRDATYHTVMETLKVGGASFIVKPSSRHTLVRKLNEVAVKLGWKERFCADPAQPLGFKSGSVEGAPTSPRPQVAFSPDMDPTTKIEALLKDAKEVKAMPFAIARTLELTQHARCGAQELSRVIESDAALTTKVLARANSVAYGGQKTTVSVKDAIVRLGFRETRQLVLGISIIRNFGADTNSLGFQRGAFWEHSLTVAIIARSLAIQSQIVDPDMAFVSGLVHDLGKLIFDEYMSSDYESAIELANRQRCSLRDAEDKTFGINHTDIGATLLTKWRFPDVVVKAAALHHFSTLIPKLKVDDIRSMVGLIHVADAIAKAYQCGNSGDDTLYPILDDLMHMIHVTQTVLQDFGDGIRQEISLFRNFLGIPPSDSTAKNKHDSDSHIVVSLNEGRPIFDTHRTFLSQEHGFKHLPVNSAEQLDGIDDLDQAVIVIDASDTEIDRERVISLLSDRPVRGAILLLGGRSQGNNTEAADWPADRLTIMETPLNGRSLLSAISQIRCQS